MAVLIMGNFLSDFLASNVQLVQGAPPLRWWRFLLSASPAGSCDVQVLAMYSGPQARLIYHTPRPSPASHSSWKRPDAQALRARLPLKRAVGKHVLHTILDPALLAGCDLIAHTDYKYALNLHIHPAAPA